MKIFNNLYIYTVYKYSTFSLIHEPEFYSEYTIPNERKVNPFIAILESNKKRHLTFPINVYTYYKTQNNSY